MQNGLAAIPPGSTAALEAVIINYRKDSAQYDLIRYMLYSEDVLLFPSF